MPHTVLETDKKPAAPKKAAAKPKPAAKPLSTPFSDLEDIRLGMKVRDPATGLVGIAIYKTLLISGTVQYAIQPQGSGDDIPKAHFVDDFMLEFVDDGVSAQAPEEDPNANFDLGEELQDTISGFKGIAVERTTYLNGCVHYTLQPKAKNKSLIGALFGESARAEHYDYKRLKSLAPAPGALKVKKGETKKKAEFKRSSTGGPTRADTHTRRPH